MRAHNSLFCKLFNIKKKCEPNVVNTWLQRTEKAAEGNSKRTNTMKNLLTLLCAGLLCGAFAFSVGCAADQDTDDKDKKVQKDDEKKMDDDKKKEEEKKMEEDKKKSRKSGY